MISLLHECRQPIENGLRCDAGYDLFRSGVCNLNEVAAIAAYKVAPTWWEIADANS